MPVKTITILENHKVELDRLQSEADPIKRVVYIDPSNTIIKNVKLRVMWHSDLSAMCTDVYYRGEKVMHFYCGLGTCNETKDQDVTDLTSKGDNDIVFKVYKCPIWHPWAVTVIISAYLDVEYEPKGGGEGGDNEPVVEPKKPIFENWQDYLKYGLPLIGGLLIGMLLSGRQGEVVVVEGGKHE